MKSKKKIFRNALLFILLIILTFYILLKDQDYNEMLAILENVKMQYVFIAVICMCIYVLCEAINIKRTPNLLYA